MPSAATATSAKVPTIAATWIVSNTTAAHVGILNTLLIQFAITNRLCEIAEALQINEWWAVLPGQMFHPATTALLICLLYLPLICNMSQKAC